MKTEVCFSLALLVLLAVSAPASAQNEQGFFALGKASTLGLGGDLGYKFNNYLAARVNLNGFILDLGKHSYSNFSISQTAFLLSAGAVVDLYPFGGWDNRFLRQLYVSGGLYLNWNEGRGNANINPFQFYNFGGDIVLGATVGSPKVRIKYNFVNPYLGLGWQGWFTPDSNWQFQVNAGVLFQGQADVKIREYNALSPGVVREINRIRSDIKNVADNYQVYPVLSLGIGYKF